MKLPNGYVTIVIDASWHWSQLLTILMYMLYEKKKVFDYSREFKRMMLNKAGTTGCGTWHSSHAVETIEENLS